MTWVTGVTGVTVAADSRERMVQSAVRLLRERGYSGMGFREVVAHSGAPRGSIYHHFPNGKTQLGAEAVTEFAEFVRDAIGAVVQAHPGDPIAALRVFVAAWREIVRADDFQAGCPVVAVSVEAHDTPVLSEAAVAAFAMWRTGLAGVIEAAGVPAARAKSMATTAIAAIEGAVIMCRVERSTQPVDDVGAELEIALRAAMS